MFGFVSKKKYDALMKTAARESLEAILLRTENLRLRLETKAKAPEQFSASEIESLIRLCHPDKHNNSSTSNDLTKKLLALRRK